MRLRKIHIQNFRSIPDCTLEPTQICALVGENNAGKSNILAALKRVLGPGYLSVTSFSLEDHRDHDPERDIVITLSLDPPLEYQPFVRGESFEIPNVRVMHTRYKRPTAEAAVGDPRLDIQCLNDRGIPVQVLAKAPKRGAQHQYQPLTALPRQVRDQMRVLFVGADRSLRDQLPSARYSVLRRMLEEVNAALEGRLMGDVEGGRPVVEIFQEQLAAAFETLRTPEFQELEELLRRHSLENLGFDPEADRDRLGVRFGPFEPLDFFKALRLLYREGDLVLDALDTGHGAQNALFLAIFQAYEALQLSAAVFLIEEPEMFLQPHRRRLFYRTLKGIAERNQVIYTTHSADFVTVPDFENVRIVDRGPDGTTRIRASRLVPDDARKEKLRKEIGPERAELFFARHVVLVEGDTERLALPVYAERLGVDLDRHGISIIGVGGKRNLLFFAELVQSFGIPLTVVFDRDSGEFKDRRDDEAAFNNRLLGLTAGEVRVVEMDPDYEAVVRSALGEEAYERFCAKHSGVTKAIRGRLIAADRNTSAPREVGTLFAPWGGTTS